MEKDNKKKKVNKGTIVSSTISGILLAIIIFLIPCYFFKSWKGEIGEAGIKGEKGDDGINGKDGNDGKDGKNGEDGSSFLYGSNTPSSELGKDNDTYQNISNGDFYIKENGKWKLIYNTKGDKGSDGTSGNNGNIGNDGSDGKSSYSITILPSKNGTITIDKLAGYIDDSINVTFTPSSSYSLLNYRIDEEIIKPSVNKDSSLSITLKMKENGFVIGATFVESSLVNNISVVTQDSAINKVKIGTVTSLSSNGLYKEGESIELLIIPSKNVEGSSYKTIGITINDTPYKDLSDSKFKLNEDGNYVYTYTLTSTDISSGTIRVEGNFTLDND